jgi:hypothetical protein
VQTPPSPIEENDLELENRIRETLARRIQKLGLFERKERLLEPGEMVTQVCHECCGPEPATRDRLACYRAAGEAILFQRCETDLTTLKAPPDAPIPTLRPGAVAALGQTRKMDREFRTRWEERKDRRRLVYLLSEYAGRPAKEIADLLNLDLAMVLDDLQEEEALLRSLVE